MYLPFNQSIHVLYAQNDLLSIGIFDVIEQMYLIVGVFDEGNVVTPNCELCY
jgi:hypothetical protein